MNYQELHTAVFNRVREQQAWPNYTTTTKLKEQLEIIYACVVVVGRMLPIHLLSHTAKPVVINAVVTPNSNMYPFPSDLFLDRKDGGILSITDSTRIYLANEFVNYKNVTENYNNPYQAGNTLFHVNMQQKKIYGSASAAAITLSYVPVFTQPTTGDYTSVVVPILTENIEEVIQLIAMQVTGEKVGDYSKSKIHAALKELHSTEFNVIPGS